MNINNDIVITDGLIAELEEVFGPHLIRNSKEMSDFYKIQAYLHVIDYLKDKQVELRQAQFENTDSITIDSS
jgi:hypothetical protein